jgi:M3 family oligoendopeptidase
MSFLEARRYAEIEAEQPDVEALTAQYDAIAAALGAAHDPAEAREAFARWDALRRSFLTWRNLTELRFRQDTANPQFKAAADRLSELAPKMEGLDAAMKRRLLASPFRAALERELGRHVFALWEADAGAYDPIIEPLAVQESTLGDEYTALLAGAHFDFRGERLNLPTIGKYAEHPEREVRREAAAVKWAFFSQHRERLDAIFEELVHVRDRMARQLGYPNFVELGYRRMQRTDYGPSDVARFREAVMQHIVPLSARIVEAQAREIGVEQVMLWDESIFSRGAPPRPPQSSATVVGAARDVFGALGEEIGGFARLMVERELLDVDSREGKGGGGFCTIFPTYGLPYVFANFNGTTHDVRVTLHEMGHAFQCYASRAMPSSEYLSATAEAGEVHSMSMEFLAWPKVDAFFGSDAERYRRHHLTSSILAIPYIAAVDHFQHLVYERPDVSAAERNGFWKELEARYLPWRRYGGIEHPERGGLWQAQLHIYRFPFYYIDYGLAMSCALQFWIRSLDDHAAALNDYVALCKRGGELPFQAVVRSAGVRSPFDDGVLEEVVRRAAAYLDVA